MKEKKPMIPFHTSLHWQCWLNGWEVDSLVKVHCLLSCAQVKSLLHYSWIALKKCSFCGLRSSPMWVAWFPSCKHVYHDWCVSTILGPPLSVFKEMWGGNAQILVECYGIQEARFINSCQGWRQAHHEGRATLSSS